MLSEETEKLLNKLSPKQKAFVVAYATPSSPTAGQGAKSALTAGYSAKTAGSQCSQVLAKTKVKKAILHVERDYREAEAEINLIDKAWIHRFLTRLARTNMMDFVSDRGDLDIAALKADPVASLRVQKIRVKTATPPFENEIHVEFFAIKDIVKMLGEHTDVGAWIERMEIDESSDLGERIREARKRLRNGRACGHLNLVEGRG